jgi:hypothetical protein
VVTTGSPTFFTAPTGTNPSFVPASGDTQLTAKGSTGNGVPTSDIGFDPKCIVKRTPVMVGQVARVSTWQYDVDIEYIKSIGGVAKCFHAATRSGNPDVGAYRAGTVTTVTPGSCVAPPMGGSGGAGGNAGAAQGGGGSGGAIGGNAGAAQGGAGGIGAGTGGTDLAGASGFGGVPSAGNGGVGFGGAAGSLGGVAGSPGGAAGLLGGAAGSPGGAAPGGGTSAGAPFTGGSGAASGSAGSGVSTGGAAAGVSGTGAPGAGGPGEDAEAAPSGCGCRVPRSLSGERTLAALGLSTLCAFAIRRRRRPSEKRDAQR